MSLARNPNMVYAVAGEQQRAFEKMHVHRHVHAPSADACDDPSVRTSYCAPAAVRRKRGDFSISMRATVTLALLTVLVLGILYLSAVAERNHVYKERQHIVDEIRAAQSAIVLLEQEVAKACQPTRICYRAVQAFGMISCQGADKIELIAPETRPLQAMARAARGT